jgi:hypothetical protein
MGNGVNSLRDTIVWRCCLVGFGTVSSNKMKRNENKCIIYLLFHLNYVSVKPHVTILYKSLRPMLVSRDSAFGIATDYGLDD